MKLSKLKLWNYRCFGSEEQVILIDQLTTFIGNNSAGKTAALSALTPQENSVPLKEVATFSQGIQVEPKDQFLDMIPGRVRFLRIVDFVSENEPLRYIAQPNVKYIKTDQELVMIRHLESCLQRGSMVRSCKRSSGARTDHAKSSSLLQRRCVRLSGLPWLSL